MMLLNVASPRACAGPCAFALPRPAQPCSVMAALPARPCRERGRPPRLRSRVTMGLSKAQLRSVDTALDRLNQSPCHREGDAEIVSDAHMVLAAERRVKFNWGTLPGRLDPHTMTWRGSSLGGQGCGVNTTSHDSMKRTVNPRSARKRAQVKCVLGPSALQHAFIASL